MGLSMPMLFSREEGLDWNPSGQGGGKTALSYWFCQRLAPLPAQLRGRIAATRVVPRELLTRP